MGDIIHDMVVVQTGGDIPLRSQFELIEQLHIVSLFGLEVHIALLKVVRVNHAHIRVELWVCRAGDAPRVGQRKRMFGIETVLARQRLSDEEMVDGTVEVLLVAVQLHQTVFKAQAGAQTEFVPIGGGELHIGGGNVLTVQQVAAEAFGRMPASAVAIVKIVV